MTIRFLGTGTKYPGYSIINKSDVEEIYHVLDVHENSIIKHSISPKKKLENSVIKHFHSTSRKKAREFYSGVAH